MIHFNFDLAPIAIGKKGKGAN